MTGHIWHYLAVLGALLQVPPSAEGRGYRIIAGRKATTLEFPYQVGIERMGRQWCGGSIIHPRFILTASHCVKTFEGVKPIPETMMRVRVGNDIAMMGGTVYEILEAIPHEKYNDNARMDQYDIALLALQTPLLLSDRAAIIQLSSVTPNPGEKGWVTGFGKQEMARRNFMKGRHLMAVELPVVSLESCRELLQGVADDMICAGHKTGHRDSCTGDSGGPYVVNDLQVGIVAWGIGCGREGLPGVYTNVALYKDWVEEKMNSYKFQN